LLMGAVWLYSGQIIFQVRFGALLGTQVHHRSVLGRCRHCSGNYKARGASGGKYKAWIVIFRILAAVNRFSWISRKVESRQGKSESRWRKQKAVEEKESRWGKQKAVEESWKAVEENQILGEKNQISGRENLDISQEIL
jgi:hypothetical protein